MFTVNDSISPPFRTNVELNGVPVCMEIDMGVAQSISSEEIYQELIVTGQKLLQEDVSTKLVTNMGE